MPLTAMHTLLTFLGAIPYDKTQYYFDGTPEQASVPTPYVQEAILRHLALKGKRIERVIVFTTENAQENNYERCIRSFDKNSGIPEYDKQEPGLQERLERLKRENIIDDYKRVLISDGNTEREIFEIFSVLYEQVAALPEGSAIALDLTYGFRSLPMLCMLLLHYARTLHHLRVSHIFYGNYEVGRQEKQAKIQELKKSGASEEEMEKANTQPPRAPVLELSAFVELQEWTIAAHTFVRSGDASLLVERMNEEERATGEALRTFTDQILTCRGSALATQSNVESIREKIRALQGKSNLGAPLKPILERVERKLEPFANRTARNGFAAVEWCIEHNLIQQGFTLLEETCKSYVIEQIYGIERLQEANLRECAKLALNRVPEGKWKPEQEEYAKKITEYLKREYPNAFRAYRRLTGEKGLRNDINHAGYMASPKSPQELKEALKGVYVEIKEAFQL
ncbi:MAG: TM1812 family CRISPR-associated protein [Saprospiraceae bacterium]|nr:TM1812 family CRISPR-associated protein [Saprospiraceae bacterium]MDW8483101.1 TM1812 family CRISPR-associated protein [Saprospiraceae bacterium]